MAIIVDKEKKKHSIALAAKELLLKKGLQNITVREIADAAGIGKGTVYEYFEKKEDVLFELARILMQEHIGELTLHLEQKPTVRSKIHAFASFFYDTRYKTMRDIYKQFIAHTMLYPSQKMIAFNTECIEEYRGWFCRLLEEGVNKGELKREMLYLGNGLFALGNGLFMQEHIIDSPHSIQASLTTFIDTLFDTMETT